MNISLDKFNIGKKISKLRSEKGMTTIELAEKIGRDQSTISRIENGQRSISLDLLNEFGRALNVNPLSLLSDEFKEPVSHSRKGLIGHIISYAREHKCISEKEACSFLCIRSRDLTCYENSMALPGKTVLKKMCGLYGLNETYIQELLVLEEECPDIAMRLGRVIGVIVECLEMANEIGCNDSRIRAIKSRLQYCLDQSAGN